MPPDLYSPSGRLLRSWDPAETPRENTREGRHFLKRTLAKALGGLGVPNKAIQRHVEKIAREAPDDWRRWSVDLFYVSGVGVAARWYRNDQARTEPLGH